MKKFLLNLLFVALTIPWITQAQAQCSDNADMCAIRVEAQDGYGDGWEGSTLKIYQGTNLVGSVTVTSTDAFSATFSFQVCPDSIRLEWMNAGGWYDDECTFTIYDAGGAAIYSAAAYDMYGVSGHFATVNVTCPTCFVPQAFATTGNTVSSVSLKWNPGSQSDMGYEIAYGPNGFLPGDINSNLISNITDTAYTVTNLSFDTLYDFFVRTDCSGGDYSGWTGPISVQPGLYKMRTNGTDTLYTCGISISDDGGVNGSYSSNCNGKVVIYPGSEDSVLVFSGRMIDCERNYDVLKIYDGVGTSGALLGLYEGQNVEIPATYSESGPITVEFTSDYGGNYQGFTLNVACAERPACSRVTELNIVSLTSNEVTLSWVDTSFTYYYELEYDTLGFATGFGTTATTSDTVFTISNLEPDTEYEIHVRINCSNGGQSLPRIVKFRTACLPVPADSLPFIETFDNPLSSCWKIYSYGDGLNPQVGGSMLKLHNYARSTYSIAVLPLFETPVNELTVNFNLLTSSSNDSIEVGVMSNPADANTFTLIKRFSVTTNNQWQNVTAFLSQYTGEGTFIAFRTSGLSSYIDYYIDSVVVDMQPLCSAPQNVRALQVGQTSAIIAWEANAVGETIEYEVEISESGADAWTPYATTTSRMQRLEYINLNTEYDVRVRTICSDANSEWNTISFKTKSCTGAGDIDSTTVPNTLLVGDTTTDFSTYGLPVNSNYGYSFTQQIFLAEELANLGTLSSISFENVTDITATRNIAIYLSTTDQGEMSNFIAGNDMLEVFNGSVTFNTGWNTINFSTLYPYGGNGNLLITVIDNTGSYLYTYPEFSVHNAGGNKTMRAQNDYTAYNPAGLPSSGSQYNMRNNIILNGYPCDTNTDNACIAPLVIVSNVGVDNASIAWVRGNNEQSWDVEYKAEDDSVWTPLVTATTIDSLYISNLTPNVTYNVKVTANCGSSTASTIVDITTTCSTLDIYPYNENFNSTVGNVPSCWTGFSTYSQSYPCTTTGYDFLDNGKSINMYCYATATESNNTYTMLVTPEIDTNIYRANELQVSFSLFRSDSYYQYAGIIVGVMTNPNDYSTFAPIDTVMLYSNSVWENYEIPLNNYQGSGSYIAFVSKNLGINTNSIYIDNFQLNLIPTCPRPRDVEAISTNITTTTANLSWESTDADQYIVEYGPFGFELGTGMFAIAQTNTVNLTNLTPSTMYTVYVRGVCSDQDSSEYSYAYTFATQCSTIDTLPFAENFNNWRGTGVRIPYCWTRGSLDYPYLSSVRDADNIEGGQSLYFYFNAQNFNPEWVSLPELGNQIDVANTKVSFKLISPYSSTLYEAGVIVGVAADPTRIDSAFTPIDTIIATPEQWTHQEISLEQYSGQGKYITFVTYANLISPDYYYAYPDIAIDNVVVETLPSCRRTYDLAATNISNTSADLSWQGGGSATSWEIEYGPAGFQAGSGTIVIANSNPYTLNGLTPSTQYEYNVRAICSATDSGEYALTRTMFTTLQNAANIPYTYDFEDATEWSNWQTISNSTTINWNRGTAAANGGSYSMYISADNGTTNSSSFTTSAINVSAYRDIDFGTTASSFVLSFDARVGRSMSSNSYDGLAVLMVDPNANVTSSNTAYQTPWGNLEDIEYLGYYAFGDTTWHNINIPLDSISGTKRIAFFWFNRETISSGISYAGKPSAVDNISITVATCPRPTNLQVVSTTTSTATLSWDGSSSGYIVDYIGINDNAISSVYTNTNSCTLTGLEGGATSYDWAVRSICGNDTSIRSNASTFTTQCYDGAIATFPFVEEFESNIDCWAIEYIANTVDWEITYEIGDYYSPTSAYSGNNFAKFSADSWEATSSRLISPVFDLTSVDNPYITYAHIQPEWFGDQDTLGVYYRVHADSAWVYLTSYTNDIAAWQLDSLALPNPSATYQVAFLAEGMFGYGVGIDRVIIDGDGGCGVPSLTATVANNTATISWTTNGNYELRYRKADEAAFGNIIVVSNATEYTITGLDPLTEYVCQVRMDCGEDVGYSNWAEVTFTTEELPCGVPTNITASNITFTSATLTWTDPNGTQTSWNVEYGYGENIQTVTATTNSIELTDLYAGTVYNVRVQGNCSETVSSDWSEVYTFSTTTCESVSNLTADGITSSSATIAWTAPAGQTKWELSYGMQGVDEEHGTRVVVENNPTYTIEGLDEDMAYDVYVRAICQEGVYGSWSSKLQFTTRPVSINTAANDNVNVSIYPNPANTEATISVEGINGKVEFAVADMNGRMIVTETINCDGQLVKTIDVSNLAKGAYFVHIYNDNFNTTRKLIVK